MFYGKYRGKVAANNDPLRQGRVQVLVPAISDGLLNWALPCTIYAGPKLGWYTIPPVGANVWVEFEGGDPNYPIWSGCFWGSEEAQGPPPDATGPDLKVFQTDKMVMIFDDKLIKLTVKVPTDAGTMTIVIDQSGIVLTSDKVTTTVAPDKIELKKTPVTFTIDDAATTKKAAASITLSDSITLKNGAASAEVAAASIDLKNGAASVSLSPASVSLNNGALEVI
ncbi:MAG TPA: phage baseplate assembly protein V [Roseiflexaceae bacterium]